MIKLIISILFPFLLNKSLHFFRTIISSFELQLVLFYFSVEGPWVRYSESSSIFQASNGGPEVEGDPYQKRIFYFLCDVKVKILRTIDKYNLYKIYENFFIGELIMRTMTFFS